MCNPRLKTEYEGAHGFTLVEVMISVAVLSIAMFAIMSFFISQHKVDATNQRNFVQQQGGMFLLSTLTKDLRRAGYMHSSSGADQDVDIAERKKIRFYVDSASQVIYEYNSTTNSLVHYDDFYTVGRTIYDELNITTLSFKYYDSSDTEISSPVVSSDLDEIVRIDIYFEVRPNSSEIGGGNIEAISFGNSVRPRNLGMYEE